MLNIYSEIFPQTPTEYDNDLCSRIENFKNVSPEEMNIKPENHHTELWELSIKSIFAQILGLQRIDKKVTPRSKLNALVDAYNLIIDSIEIFSKNKEGAGAEDSVPVLTYLLTKAKLPRINSTLK